MKFFYLIIIFLLFSTSIAYASFTYQRTFSTEDGVEGNVITLWYTCLNSVCTSVKTSPISNLFSPNPKTILSTSTLNINVPNCAEASGYFVRYFFEGYRPWEEGPWTYSCYNTYYTYPPINVPFDRKDNCKGEITPTIQSCEEAGFPISILTDTYLDAETKSAFCYSTTDPDCLNGYYPSTHFDPSYSGPNYDEWITIETKMDVDIKKQGSSTSESGFPKTDTADIYSGDTHDFTFTWQSSKDTDPGVYEITITSTVPDTKCDQATMIPVTKTMEVNLAASPDTCRAEISDFEINNIGLNQEIRFSGKKISEFQDWDYTYIDECNLQDTSLNSVDFFDADYVLKITDRDTNQVVETITGTFTKNTEMNTPTVFSIPWQTNNPGDYKVSLTMTSHDPNNKCLNQGVKTSQVSTFQIGEDLDNDDHYVTDDFDGEDCDDDDNTVYQGTV